MIGSPTVEGHRFDHKCILDFLGDFFQWRTAAIPRRLNKKAVSENLEHSVDR
jgi:hypothetical protein